MVTQFDSRSHNRSAVCDVSELELVPSEIQRQTRDYEIEKAKSIICALNYLSRNLPLPEDILESVSNIVQSSDDNNEDSDADRVENTPSTTEKDNSRFSRYGDVLTDFDNAVMQKQANVKSSHVLANQRDQRFQSHINYRLTDLEELPATRGEDLQSKCFLELYGLKLKDLQQKVRSEVSSEYWLRKLSANPSEHLFDWGMSRLPRPVYGISDAFAVQNNDSLYAERLSILEAKEKNIIELKQKKFLAEIVNGARELQLQIQASQKRRKQRYDGVLSWHGRQRQRASRQEKLRFQALKTDDQDTYMKMVEESKNERLRMLLSKTNELLSRLGAAVQRQKDSHFDGIEPLPPGEESSLPTVKSDDLLQGQREYNSAVHSIQEKVTEQPAMLQGGELRPYQLEGLQWMLSLCNNNLNGILADEMGLGKTIQTISLIAYLMENKGINGPFLIVAPKAVLPNWMHEFSTWAPSIVAVLYDGRIEERKALREEYSDIGKFNVLVTHYDLIMRDKAFLKKIQWYYMIVDEGHRLKNHECALAQTLIKGYQIRKRLLLTGTPIQNTLQELWSLLNFLLPNIFNSVENFEEWFNAPFADKSDVALTDEEELLVIRRLHHVIRPFILRRKKAEVEKFLPGKTQVMLKCDMSAWQKVYYHQVTGKGRVGLDNGSGRSKSLQNLTMQLRKCCNHPYLFINEYNIWKKEEIVRASGKFELLDRLLPKLRRAGHRVLLFSQMTRLMDILEVYLQLHDFKYLRLDGSTKTEERGSLLKQFNDPDSPYFMFMLSTRAGGLGLNLQTADTVIIFDSDWNPQMDQQAEDRAHRIGQTKEVRVFVLVSVGSIEEVILERAKQKMGIDAKVIQAGMFNTTSTAQDRRAMLEEIMRKGTSSLGQDVPSEREINRLAARSEEEFWLFEKMDEERRQKEKFKCRLMEDHEVPEWAHVPAEGKDDKGKGFEFESANVSGKRRRKEVVYSDRVSDDQYLNAVEYGDNSKVSDKGKRSNEAETEQPDSSIGLNFSDGNTSQGEELRSESIVIANEVVTSVNPNPETSEYQGVSGTNFGDGLSWKPYKKRRTSFVHI